MCLLSESQKGYIIVILMKNRLHVIKLFGRPLSFFLSDKVVSKEKITLIEKDKIVESNINTVQILNTFFLNAISNLKIAE